MGVKMGKLRSCSIYVLPIAILGHRNMPRTRNVAARVRADAEEGSFRPKRGDFTDINTVDGNVSRQKIAVAS